MAIAYHPSSSLSSLPPLLHVFPLSEKARRVSVGGWQSAMPQRIKAGAIAGARPQRIRMGGFAAGFLGREAPETWDIGQAAALAIGWFDTEKMEEWLASLRDSETETRLSTGNAPLSEQSQFIRRLAAALQPPLSTLTAPGGILEWPAPLLDYQHQGVAALLSRKGCCLPTTWGWENRFKRLLRCEFCGIRRR